MIGKPIYVTRALETLSKINQSALEQCKVTEYLHKNCRATEHVPMIPPARPPMIIPPDDLPLVDVTDPHLPVTPLQLDPDPDTIVWVRTDTPHHQGPNQEPSHQRAQDDGPELITDQLPTPHRQLFDPEYLNESNSEYVETDPPVEIQEPSPASSNQGSQEDGPELAVDQPPTLSRQLFEPNYLKESNTEHDYTELPVEGHETTHAQESGPTEVSEHHSKNPNDLEENEKESDDTEQPEGAHRVTEVREPKLRKSARTPVPKIDGDYVYQKP